MPTERFFRLPEEKRRRVIDAAVAELKRAPFDQISINKIIRSADIPRGSFYQYFDNKLDLLDFLLAGCKAEVERAILKTLRETGGDLFAVFSAILRAVVNLGSQEENALLFRNIFPHLKLEDSQRIFPFLRIQTLASAPPGCCQTEAYQTFFRYLRKLLDSGVPEDDLLDTLEMLTAALRYTVAQVFFHPELQREAQNHFANKLAILKRGLLGEEN